MTRLLFAYFGALVTICALDFLWLGFIARGFYQDQVGTLLLAKPQWVPALVFYALYAAGVVLFVTVPALEAGSLGRAAVYGALFGLVAYATYDLTNLATLRGWTIAVALADIGWGALVSAAAASVGYLLAGLAGRLA